MNSLFLLIIICLIYHHLIIASNSNLQMDLGMKNKNNDYC